MVDHFLQVAEPYLDRYGYLALFMSVFVEGFGIPAPGETLIIATGLLAAKGDVHIDLVLLIAWLAAVAGDNVGFAIGHFGGRRLALRYGAKVGVGMNALERVERFFERYGSAVVATARFVEGLRQLNGIVAGTSGMSWWRFLFYNASGAALWVGCWGGGAYLLGARVETLLGHFRHGELAVAIVAGVAVIIGLTLLRRARDH